MAEASKKLYIRRNGVVTTIKLYTTTSEVGSDYLTLRDGVTPIYAKLGITTDSNASVLRVKKNGTTYAVLTQASVPTNPISSSIYLPSTAAAAFDGSVDTYAGTVATNKCLGLDFGSPKVVNKVIITGVAVQVASYPVARYVLSGNQVYLRYSNDGTNWTNVQLLTGMLCDNGIYDKRVYSWDITEPRQAARYWTIYWDTNAMTSGPSGQIIFGAREIQFLGG